MSWSPDQQRLLAAMGYPLYRPLAAAPAPLATAAESLALAPSPPSAPAEDRLLQSLRRAAGRRDLSGIVLPPLATLRADPAAKRALWPILRQLRKH